MLSNDTEQHGSTINKAIAMQEDQGTAYPYTDPEQDGCSEGIRLMRRLPNVSFVDTVMVRREYHAK